MAIFAQLSERRVIECLTIGLFFLSLVSNTFRLRHVTLSQVWRPDLNFPFSLVSLLEGWRLTPRL
jgi:hypothetical protein